MIIGRKRIIGYSDKLSVQAGDKISFMVSSELPDYKADIVRLIHGDDSPKGPGFQEELIATSVSGVYKGKKQTFPKGSYVMIDDDPSFSKLGSLTLQAWIYPTTPKKGAQAIVSKWSEEEAGGFGLFVDEDGSLGFWSKDKGGRSQKVRTGKPLRESHWYFVACTYDSSSGKVVLVQEPLIEWPYDESTATSTFEAGKGAAVGNKLPLLVAACWTTESGKTKPTCLFNGKIDGPRVFSAAVDDVRALKSEKIAADLQASLVADLDFSADISSAKVTDRSPNRLQGKAVNIPTRAVTGHNWTGDEQNFRYALSQYNAIHFHDDDLEDSRWEVAFEFDVPANFRSGIYAARLKAGDAEDYVAFYVRPKKGTATARIALLIPTLSAIAYSNLHTNLENPTTQRLIGIPPEVKYPVQEDDTYIIENGLLSLYDKHTDGSGVCQVTRLEPMAIMRPKYDSPDACYGLGMPHQLGADLHLARWMEVKGFDFDVITDEDLHYEGVDLLSRYKVVVSGTHPEYPTKNMVDSLVAYFRRGGRFMYLGGNGFVTVTSIDPTRPHVIEIRRGSHGGVWKSAPGEYYHSTTGEFGGPWRSRGYAPQKWLGIGMTAQGFDRNRPYVRAPGKLDPKLAFIFEGTGDDEVIGDFDNLVMEWGAAGMETDRFDFDLGTPRHTNLLATATGFSNSYQTGSEDAIWTDPLSGGQTNPLVRADMTYLKYPNDGAVFSVGSISYCGCLFYNNYNNNVSRITENVLRRFESEKALP